MCGVSEAMCEPLAICCERRQPYAVSSLKVIRLHSEATVTVAYLKPWLHVGRAAEGRSRGTVTIFHATFSG